LAPHGIRQCARFQPQTRAVVILWRASESWPSSAVAITTHSLALRLLGLSRTPPTLSPVTCRPFAAAAAAAATSFLFILAFHSAARGQRLRQLPNRRLWPGTHTLSLTRNIPTPRSRDLGTPPTSPQYRNGQCAFSPHSRIRHRHRSRPQSILSTRPPNSSPLCGGESL
jgi:hypothetical protein